MLFSSYLFIFIFLPIVLIGYFSLNRFYSHTNWGKYFLVLSSLFFYGYWFPPYLILILSSVVINYFASKRLIQSPTKPLFYFSLSFNVGLLGYFKYRDYFLDHLNYLFGSDFHFMALALPLGISFYTLQQIAYIVDSYQGVTKKSKLLDYSLFVTFFPQLIAGPIVHYKGLISQFESSQNKQFDTKNFNLGMYIFIIGLFKKVMIADTFSTWANPGFNSLETLHLFEAWGTTLSYTMQLYFDFSGYSDMAIGLGYMFNIRIPKNFNSPFKSRNVIEFWTRWHITLSQFINIYVFTPLFRSFKKLSFRNSLISIFITMLIAGLWHGAGHTFILYGALHGFAIVINHLLKKKKIKFPKALAIFLTFNFTNIVFTMFRANTVDSALSIYKSMFDFSNVRIPKGIVKTATLQKWGADIGQHMNNDENLNLLMLIVCLVVVFKAKNSMQKAETFNPTYKTSFVLAFMFIISLYGINRVSEFIYFNF